MTAAPVSRARSNTDCAAAAAAAAAVVAAAVVLLHEGQHVDKQIRYQVRSDQGTSGKARPRHRVTKGRRVPLLAVTGRHCVLRADIPRAW